ncbi:MAG: AN1-type zinc finger domain-containing protein [Candidatus Heimdallarchaeaceae archaeon]
MKCEHPQCNTEADILFYCRFCRGSFCQQHRDANRHSCQSLRQPQQSTQGTQQGSPQGQVRAEDVVRKIAYGVAQAAQKASQQQAQAQQPMHFPDEKSKKDFIAKRLTSSGEMFSLGNEILDILAGFAMIVLVFGFFQFIRAEEGTNKWWGFAIAAILVGTAFLPHELAHKFVAIKKGQFARYILWVRGMLFTLLTLVLGIGLIVPGFVAIVPMSRQMDKRDLGLVAFAGPAINAVIGGISLIIGLLTYSGYAVEFVGPLAMIGLFGKPNIFILVAQFNGLIALFNCIPIWQLDGKKILNWNKVAFFILVAINLAIIIPTFILNPNFLSAVS